MDNTEIKTEQVNQMDPVLYWKTRAKNAEANLESYKLVCSYVQDLVDMWPTITLRTLWKATNKIADLKEALTLTK